MNFKSLILLFAILIILTNVKAQTNPGPVEKRLADSICNAMARKDFSKIKTKQDAMAAFAQSFTKYPSLLLAVAEERKVNVADREAMRQLGTDIGKDLLKMNCESFMKLSIAMASNEQQKQEEVQHFTEGKLLRIDNKGFNYFVIVDQDKKEHSFLWLRQFSGSEAFVNGLGSNIGKTVSIHWQEMEVFLPSAKGYFNVKEIIGLAVL
jgi:hypothetical protein